MRLVLACLTAVVLSGCLAMTPERIRLSNEDFAVQSTQLDPTQLFGSP